MSEILYSYVGPRRSHYELRFLIYSHEYGVMVMTERGATLSDIINAAIYFRALEVQPGAKPTPKVGEKRYQLARLYGCAPTDHFLRIDNIVQVSEADVEISMRPPTASFRRRSDAPYPAW